MRKIVTGLMGLTIAVALVSTASADPWHHHRYYGYYRPAPAVAVYAAPRRVYYPYPAAVVAPPCVAPAPVAVVPAVPYGPSIGISTRRFSFGVGF
jgi:hypothetical protein